MEYSREPYSENFESLAIGSTNFIINNADHILAVIIILGFWVWFKLRHNCKKKRNLDTSYHDKKLQGYKINIWLRFILENMF